MISDGEWTHVIGVVRGPTDMSVYLNGEPIAVNLSGEGVGPMAHVPTAGPNIGSWQLVDTNQPWKGRLDEFRLYACALDGDEAATLAEP